MSFTSEEEGRGLRSPLFGEEISTDWAEAAVAIAEVAIAEGLSKTTAPMPMEIDRSRSKKMNFYHEQSKWSDDVVTRSRSGFLNDLVFQRQLSMRNLFQGFQDEEEGIQDVSAKISMEMDSAFVRRLQKYAEELGSHAMPSVEIRVKDFSFNVPIISESEAGKKEGVKLFRKRNIEAAIKRKEVKSVLSHVNLALEPGKMYLIIGPPQSGKTSLLKAIGGMLQGDLFEKVGVSPKKLLSGQVLYNNLVCCGEDTDETLRTLFKNMVSFVGQTDDHAPRYTVEETFQFSNMCKFSPHDQRRVELVLEGLGLSHVRHTFVGSEKIRGVSGGQRRRVTLGEMLVFPTPLLCGDEISTGLDAASTVEIMRVLSYASRVLNRVTVVSLLQPSPEAVALFDEVILLGDGGHVIFAGPTSNASAHFVALDFKQPDGMDDADFLLSVASRDRHLVSGSDEALSSESLRIEFQKSKEHAKIMNRLQRKWEHNWSADSREKAPDAFHKQYQNSLWASVQLNFKRAFALWKRDVPTIIANQVVRNINVGISTGCLFLHSQDGPPGNFVKAIYQVNLVTIMLGACVQVNALMDDRSIFYKHHNSNFYSALSYILGQVAALVPSMLIDAAVLGSLLYWMVGFRATADAFVIYLLFFFTFNMLIVQLFSVFVALAPNKSLLAGACTVTIFFNTLFCGYIVTPDVIPIYWRWLYWLLPSAWVYRGLVLNQITDKAQLKRFGIHSDGVPFAKEWIGYGFAFVIGAFILSTLVSAFCLHLLRLEGTQKGTPGVPKIEDDNIEEKEDTTTAQPTFTSVNLSFRDLSYEVRASKRSEKLRLLKSVSGIFRAGRMCALMGESGAGKTTLMDVIALRKGSAFSFRGNTGITGDVLLNGFAQEQTSFKRCSGYVEQFDVQSAELTVRETIRFSAQLRLDKTNPLHKFPDELELYVDQIIETIGLTREADLLVGTNEANGLTFEQKKRLSIAVELAASPSLIFLDEPTSGLDAGAALLVVNALRKMADQGRTVVATIHQPNSTVFDMFDDLLLLQKGGEVVFHDELGVCSSNLISYFEGLGADPICLGENPSTWMLNVLNKKAITNSKGELESIDFAKAWKKSANYDALQDELDQLAEVRDEKLQIRYDTKYAQPWYRRDRLMMRRLVKIYWRSPGYNGTRMLLVLAMAVLLGSMFYPIRSILVLTESQIHSMFGVVYISFIIIGQLLITSIIPVTISIRDMYYRHAAAGMLGSRSVMAGLLAAELPFIAAISLFFPVIFLALFNMPQGNLWQHFIRGVFFYFFFGMNTAIYSYVGQMFSFLVPGQGTAMVLANIFIGLNNAYSGFIASPNILTSKFFFAVQYYFVPGHYVYQGMLLSLFWQDDSRMVIIPEASPYYRTLDCEAQKSGECKVSVSNYFVAYFDDQWGTRKEYVSLIVLILWTTCAFGISSIALKYFKYSGK